ncbi:fadB [Symbiodinium sp. CCMP2592]|nr:fadB [Symbiodinium sp. CCMP2592]
MAQGKGSSCLRSSLLGVPAYFLGVLTVVCFDAARVSRREGEGSVEPFETSTTQALRASDVSEHGSEFRPESEAEPPTTTSTPVLTTAKVKAGTKDNEDPIPSPDLHCACDTLGSSLSTSAKQVSSSCAGALGIVKSTATSMGRSGSSRRQSVKSMIGFW